MKEWVLTSIICFRNYESWNLQETKIESSLFKIVTYLTRPIKKSKRNNRRCYMVHTNSSTIQLQFITIHALNS